jgi:hypothetical protein
MIRRLFLGVAVLFVIGGCGHGNSSPKDPSDFSYNPPDGFKQQDKQKNGATVFLGSTDDGIESNLIVRSSNTRETAKQIGEETLAKLTVGSGVTVKEQVPYTLPDSDAYTWQISKTRPDGIVAAQRQFVVAKNGVAVEFTLTSSAKTIDAYDQALADSLQTFKWGRS